ncbi:hypothetical protein C0992_009556, partial [Termitomyces sp. T32_za158]
DTTDAASIVNFCIRKAIILRGIQIGSRTQYVYVFSPLFRLLVNFHPRRFVNMNRMIAAHPITTRPYIDRVFPFEKAKEAYSYLKSQAHVGKVVIKVTRD